MLYMFILYLMLELDMVLGLFCYQVAIDRKFRKILTSCAEWQDG